MPERVEIGPISGIAHAAAKTLNKIVLARTMSADTSSVPTAVAMAALLLPKVA